MSENVVDQGAHAQKLDQWLRWTPPQTIAFALRIASRASGCCPHLRIDRCIGARSALAESRARYYRSLSKIREAHLSRLRGAVQSVGLARWKTGVSRPTSVSHSLRNAVRRAMDVARQSRTSGVRESVVEAKAVEHVEVGGKRSGTRIRFRQAVGGSSGDCGLFEFGFTDT